MVLRATASSHTAHAGKLYVSKASLHCEESCNLQCRVHDHHLISPFYYFLLFKVTRILSEGQEGGEGDCCIFIQMETLFF